MMCVTEYEWLLSLATPAYLSCCWGCRFESTEELVVTWFLWSYITFKTFHYLKVPFSTLWLLSMLPSWNLIFISLLFLLFREELRSLPAGKEIGRIMKWWSELVETIRTPEMQNQKQSILYFCITSIFSRLHSSSEREGKIWGFMQRRDLV